MNKLLKKLLLITGVSIFIILIAGWQVLWAIVAICFILWAVHDTVKDAVDEGTYNALQRFDSLKEDNS